MRIIGIESSCDDSAAAYIEIEGDRVVRLEHVVASQAIHAKYGGVVPEVAAREHSAKMPLVLDELARRVVGAADGSALGTVTDAVAATAGPGLITSLRVGLDTGRALAAAWGKPFFGINHIEGHIYSNWLPSASGDARVTVGADIFPTLVLVVSGGHTELLLMRAHGEYELLGATLDDAAGECFDKTAKLMGLGYPGGPALSKLAAGGDAAAFDFPRPMIDAAGYMFSFSGLKTSVRYFLEREQERLGDDKFRADVAASAEQAIVDVLAAKAARAAGEFGVRFVLLAGGVAANRRLRDALCERLAREVPETKFVEPELAFCTDNAAMIAMAGFFQSRRREPDDWRTVQANAGWELGR